MATLSMEYQCCLPGSTVHNFRIYVYVFIYNIYYSYFSLWFVNVIVLSCLFFFILVWMYIKTKFPGDCLLTLICIRLIFKNVVAFLFLMFIVATLWIWIMVARQLLFYWRALINICCTLTESCSRTQIRKLKWLFI